MRGYEGTSAAGIIGENSRDIQQLMWYTDPVPSHPSPHAASTGGRGVKALYI
jgi:hypothetical protein